MHLHPSLIISFLLKRTIIITEQFHFGQQEEVRVFMRISVYMLMGQIDIHLAEDFIRLSPSIPGARGYIWSDIPNPYDEWEVEVGFKVTGQHLHGGRGLAFWYAKEKSVPGPIFGSKDKWDGLSVWLDSANPVV